MEFVLSKAHDYKPFNSCFFVIEDSTEYFLNVTNIAPYGVEILEDLFDDAISTIERNEINKGKGKHYLYGGAIRDLLAGLPIEGDLDVLTTCIASLDTLFASNPKWGRVKEKSIPETQISVDKVKKDLADSPSLYSLIKKGDVTKETFDFLVKSKYNAAHKYINIHRKQVDLIECSNIHAHVLNTDLLCCCLLMSLEGKIYEMVEGALADCQSRILRINPFCKTIEKEALKNRIDKLEKRGWTSIIKLEDIVEPIKEELPIKKSAPIEWSYCTTSTSTGRSSTTSTYR